MESTSRGTDFIHVSQRLRLHGTDGGTITLLHTMRIAITPEGTVRVDTESSSLACD
ncbi:MAG: hypothetical protein ABR571_00815 [Jatrophihabitans sp.]|uniref:hypothetical protein n=1 Tax=Jatrophihabitans sp. TaxID=1932789 RepID=UPI003914526E